MDAYTFSLALGATGLVVMGLRGLGSHGHGHSQAGHHGTGHHDAGHHGPGHHDTSHAGHHGHHPETYSHGSHLFWTLASPRVWFSVLAGGGAVGLAAKSFLTEPFVAGMAIAGGLLFERFIVSPVWNFLLRFESRPALTLESAVMEEARAETDFDAKGQGLISLDLDGQVVQLLGTLTTDERRLGVRVKRGSRLRIEEVDGARNRCVVSFVHEELLKG